ncbi:hypothetical protein TPHA_0F01650 [Tetrapisispora phaffii CBS 4417]|uniref:Glycosyltransferase family 15 protein n=1 Tax=Tetrapisispora phaffii (strain ATCC 24235 / CBS 4417 / NBRC 1672 / NRRL Y-8282 / UCD 70-5) TaxID=1071381 RepID=G8BV67_TETPH|nr:hypothetical protein TPHA_0F01650 [Tetrapisispora phaffii CBS 4417]CCE63649.1 hypothetical protein TPHA_0F01650 [Tetrapisispora phaffii CBS 4417]
MAKFTIPVSSRRLYKLLGLFAIAIITIVIIVKGTDITSSLSGPIDGKSDYVQGSKKANAPKKARTKYDDKYKYVKYSIPEYKGEKVRATFVTLARNKDLNGLRETIKSFEDRFNSKFQYDWIFLNDSEFNDDFKVTMTALISGEVKFGIIPKEHWSFPSWIDQDRAADTRKEMKDIIYGDSISYRNMCRFESGFFWRHPLLDEYEYYWRVEPDTKLYCDVDYDIFRFMKDNDKKYGFTISIHEYRATIPTLWDTTVEFINLHPEYVAENNMLDFVSNDDGMSYNLCHFWSNFEIASLDFWRSDAYRDYFDYLDHAGGFFYERWGDAPVHSIAAALFLNRTQVHHFDDLGYYHGPFHQCPTDEKIRLANRCDCDPNRDFTWRGYSCGKKYYKVNNLAKPKNWADYSK